MAEYTIESVGKVTERMSKNTGKPYKIYDLKIKERSEADGWLTCFWSKDEPPKAGQVLTGEIRPAKFGDGFELELERSGGTFGAKKPFTPRDTGVDVQIAAWRAVATLIAGTVDPSDAKAFTKLEETVEQVATNIRKASDNRVTEQQRKKIFAEIGEREVPGDFVTRLRDADREGKLTKAKASEVIEAIPKYPRKEASGAEEPEKTEEKKPTLDEVPF